MVVINTFAYHQPNEAAKKILDDNRTRAIDLGVHWEDILPECVEKDQCLIHLQTALMFANAAIVLNSTPMAVDQ